MYNIDGAILDNNIHILVLHRINFVSFSYTNTSVIKKSMNIIKFKNKVMTEFNDFTVKSQIIRFLQTKVDLKNNV